MLKILQYLIGVILFVALYSLRLIIRDILIPISQTETLHMYFKESQAYQNLLYSQSILYDCFDFVVALIILYLFYHFGK